MLLVTGAPGNVGSKLVEFLAPTGHQCVRLYARHSEKAICIQVLKLSAFTAAPDSPV